MPHQNPQQNPFLNPNVVPPTDNPFAGDNDLPPVDNDPPALIPNVPNNPDPAGPLPAISGDEALTENPVNADESTTDITAAAPAVQQAEADQPPADAEEVAPDGAQPNAPMVIEVELAAQPGPTDALGNPTLSSGLRENGPEQMPMPQRGARDLRAELELAGELRRSRGRSGIVNGFLRANRAATSILDRLSSSLGIPTIIHSDSEGNIRLLTQQEVEEQGLADDDIIAQAIKYTDPQTAAGQVFSGLSQVVTSLMGAGAVLAPVRAVGAVQTTAHAAAVGGLAEFFGFGGDQPALSRVLADNIGLRNAVIDYLADRSQGDTVENRLKNTLEGLGMGAAVGAALGVFRFMKRFREALEEVDADDAQAAAGRRFLEENREELQRLADDIAALNDDAAGAANNTAVDSASPGVAARAPLAEERIAAARVEAAQAEGFSTARPAVDEARARTIALGDEADPNTVDRATPPAFNHSRMTSPQTVQDAVERMAEVQAPRIAELAQRGTKSFEQTRQEAAEYLSDVTDLGIDAIIAATARSAQNVDAQAGLLVATSQAVQSIAREAAVVARRISADGVGSVEDRAKLLILSQQWGDLTANMKAIQTGTARTVTAGRIVRGDSLDGAEINHAYILDAVSRGDVDDLAKQIDAMDGNVKGIGSVLRPKKPGPLRVTLEYFTNSLLSHPRTHLLNFTSNSVQTVALPLEKTLGGALTGRFGDAKEGLLHFWYLKESILEGSTYTGKAFRSAQGVLDNQGKLDEYFSKIAITSDRDTALGAGIRVLGNMIRTPTRLLTTGDEFFKQINYRSAVKARAHIEAGEKFGSDVARRQEYVEQRLRDSIDPETGAAFDRVTGRELNPEALAYAREATFTTPLEAGQVRVDIARTLQTAVRSNPALGFIAPFVRTPANLIRQSVVRTPGLSLVAKRNLDDFRAGGVARSRAVGRVAMGAALSGAALMAVHNGRFTGGGPADPVQRQRLMASGLRPYAATWENSDGTRSYLELGRLDPFSTVIGLATDFYDIAPSLNPEELDEAGEALAISFTRNISDKAYLTGLADALQAFAAPDRQFQRWASSLVGGFAPAGLRPVAQLVDNAEIKETRGILDKFKAKVPGLSSSLLPRNDWLTGEPLPYPEGARWWFNTLSPFPRSDRVTDRVVTELARVPHGFSAPERTLQGVELSDEQYSRLTELHGKVRIDGATLRDTLNEAMSSEDYDIDRNVYPDVADDSASNRRVRIIAPIVSAYRRAAEEALREQYPELREEIENLMRLRQGRLTGGEDTEEPAILRDIREHLEQSRDPLPFN